MSTRSAVRVITNQGNTHDVRMVDLYRHCDGYPGEAGATILDALVATGLRGALEVVPNDGGFVAYLLGLKYEHQEYEKAGGHPARHIYELTSNAEEHGDLEHVYVVHFRPRGQRTVEITHYARPGGTWDADAPESSWIFLRWPANRCTALEFAEVVNQDRRDMNKRIAELRAENPNCEHYQGDDYEMVKLPEPPAQLALV